MLISVIYDPYQVLLKDTLSHMIDPVFGQTMGPNNVWGRVLV